jgi:uncharacterized protein
MLLDTSGLLCYFDRAEARHADTVSHFHSATFRLSHSYVLAEFVPLCQARGLPRVETLAFAWDLLSDPAVELVWVNEELHRAALSLLQARLDKTYSLCDAVSFLLMRQDGVAEALTTDRHFEQEGFARLLRP